MNEPGYCTFWVQDADTEALPVGPLALATEAEEKQVVIFNVVTENVTLRLVLRRAEFSKMLATPNNAEAIDVALHIEEDA